MPTFANVWKQQAYTVDATDNGKTSLFLATTDHYDTLILHRMLPGLNGLTIIKTLHGAGNTTPAIILSALGEIEELRAKGDDYLVKPFAFTELLARIEFYCAEAIRQQTRTVCGAGQDTLSTYKPRHYVHSSSFMMAQLFTIPCGLTALGLGYFIHYFAKDH